MFDIILPVSHLFKTESNVQKLTNLYDGLETRPFTFNMEFTGQLFFHADEIQPIHELTENDFKFLEKINHNKKEMKFISFHCASCCTKPSLDSKGIYFINESNSIVYSRDQMYKNMEKNIEIIKNIFNDDVVIMIENNNFYPTKAYNHITEAEFISDIVIDNNIYFLFDNAHAQVTAHNKQINYEMYKSNLPLQRTKQIQFCKPYIPKNKKDIALDVHDYPDSQVISEIIDIAIKYNVKYITPEYYKDVNKLKKLLSELREITINENIS